MFRTFAVFVLTCSVAFTQLAAPRIGFVRLNDRTVRVLRGVAGAFSTGETVLQDVDQFYFDGARGFARSGAAVAAIDCDGAVTGPADEVPSLDDVARLEEEYLLVVATGVRLQLPFAVETIERAGTDYLLLTGSEGRLLVRIKAGQEAIYELPEPAE